MGFGFFILIGGIALVFGFVIQQGRVDDMLTACQAQIQMRGGQYLDHEKRTLRSGPFMWAGKNQIILRVRWQDSAGQVQQLWVKRSGWPFGDKFVWDHNDGE